MTDKEISRKVEQTEAEAIYQLHSNVSSGKMKEIKSSVKKFGKGTGIRTDVFPGFSFNRVFGMGFEKELDQGALNDFIDFFDGTKSIYAIQPSPLIMNDNAEKLFEKSGFIFKKNWVRFYRDTKPVGRCENRFRSS
ncbi:MAG: hypothetical protein M3P82_02385 [Bacteroidota bacterium]|nr:hypothetical protein [Bacteroidota bacterium]